MKHRSQHQPFVLSTSWTSSITLCYMGVGIAVSKVETDEVHPATVGKGECIDLLLNSILLARLSFVKTSTVHISATGFHGWVANFEILFHICCAASMLRWFWWRNGDVFRQISAWVTLHSCSIDDFDILAAMSLDFRIVVAPHFSLSKCEYTVGRDRQIFDFTCCVTCVTDAWNRKIAGEMSSAYDPADYWWMGKMTERLYWEKWPFYIVVIARVGGI